MTEDDTKAESRRRQAVVVITGPTASGKSALALDLAEKLDGVVVNASAPDGVIEGIEAPGYRFCLGVQWHPEFEISAADRAIFAAFVAACQGQSGRVQAAQ